jgi:hypothetical protein
MTGSVHDWSTTAASNTSIAGIDVGENCAAANINNAIRAAMASAKGALTAVATSGTDTYTATLAPAPAAYASGMAVFLRFGNANTAADPTINLNSLGAKTIKGPAGAAIAVGAMSGDHFLVYDGTNFRVLNPAAVSAGSFTTIELGHASDTTLSRASAGTVAVEGANLLTTSTGRKQGLETIWVPAVAMYTRTTNGAASGTVESSTNKVMTRSLDFDTSTQEFAQFAIQFPKSWNEGTVTFAPVWSAASGTGGVVWALQAVALSDDDAIDTAFGTEQTSTDTLIATGDIHVGPTSSAITIAGTPAAGDWVAFQIKRNVSDGSDTLNADARLLGVRIFFTTDASDDA